MKRVQALAMLSLTAVLLSACDQGKNQAASQEKDNKAATPATATAAPLPEFTALELPAADSMFRVPCALDKINTQRAPKQVVNLEADGEARFVGWVSDPSRRVPQSFKIVLVGANATYAVDAKADRPRPDVARTLKSGALANAGFNVMTSLRDIVPGQYDVGLFMDAGGKGAYCTTPAKVAVVKSPG
jgi:hypothetical protein